MIMYNNTVCGTSCQNLTREKGRGPRADVGDLEKLLTKLVYITLLRQLCDHS